MLERLYMDDTKYPILSKGVIYIQVLPKSKDQMVLHKMSYSFDSDEEMLY